MEITNAAAADVLLHAFRTFMGIPPDTSTPPACGAAITSAYGNVPKSGRCGKCDRLVRMHKAAKAAAAR